MLVNVKFYDKSTSKCTSDKEYTYKVPIGMKLKKNDLALVYVDVYNKGYSIVQVQKVYKEDKYEGTMNLYELKWIQSKLDFSFLDKTFTMMNRRKQLEKQINSMYEKASKLQVLKLLAQNNPDFKKLVDEYEQLDGEL